MQLFKYQIYKCRMSNDVVFEIKVIFPMTKKDARQKLLECANEGLDDPAYAESDILLMWGKFKKGGK